MAQFWTPIRKLIIFQFKLYIDAFRDVLLSIASFFAVLLDIVFQTSGPDSYFEKVLALGRRTERAINLFNHFDDQEGDTNVDSIFDKVEQSVSDKIRKENMNRNQDKSEA